MYFSRNELVAITKMAKVMTAADGRLDVKEIATIAHQLTKFSADDKVLDDADNMEASDALVILKNMTNEEKKYVCGLLATISAVDGDIDEREIAVWQFVSTLAQFPTMSFAEAMDFWSKY